VPGILCSQEEFIVKAALISSLLLLLSFGELSAQGQITPASPYRADTTSVLGALREPAAAPFVTPTSAWGVDLFVSNGGFGLGSFFRHTYSEDIAGYVDLSFSEAKDDEEKDFVDIYGRLVTPGKVNRFLVVPVFAGIEHRLFRDDIVDNFRPFVNAAAGPAVLYVFPADQEYFTGLSNGHAVYTAGGYVGLGAYFGSERSSILGLNIRYYYVPYPAGIESMQGVQKKQFGGFYITIKFGSAW
jgi:hypothetical protein